MMVSESCERHRFFSATLHGEVGSAHEEGKHGPHQRGWKDLTFLHFSFFPAPITLFIWSIATHIHRSVTRFLFGFSSHRRNTKIQSGKKDCTMLPCNLAQEFTPHTHTHSVFSHRRQWQPHYSSGKNQYAVIKIQRQPPFVLFFLLFCKMFYLFTDLPFPIILTVLLH